MTAEKDVDILVHDKFFKDKSEPGVFVEVGAALPDYLSISARFRDLDGGHEPEIDHIDDRDRRRRLGAERIARAVAGKLLPASSPTKICSKRKVRRVHEKGCAAPSTARPTSAKSKHAIPSFFDKPPIADRPTVLNTLHLNTFRA